MSNNLSNVPQISITLREWYAGMAMQGLLAGDEDGTMRYEDCAKMALLHADAMIAALEVKE